MFLISDVIFAAQWHILLIASGAAFSQSKTSDDIYLAQKDSNPENIWTYISRLKVMSFNWSAIPLFHQFICGLIKAQEVIFRSTKRHLGGSNKLVICCLAVGLPKQTFLIITLIKCDLRASSGLLGAPSSTRFGSHTLYGLVSEVTLEQGAVYNNK